MRIVHIIGWVIFILGLATIASAQEHGTETYRVTIGGDVNDDCDPGNEHTECEDIPVFVTEDEEPLTPEEQWALSVEWKKNGQ